MAQDDSVARELDTWMAHLPGVEPAVEAARQRIRRLARLLDRVLDEAAAGHDLTVGDWEALSVLQRAGPPHEMAPTALAGVLGVTSGTMSVRLDRLVRAGFVEPVAGGAADGRRRPVRLTARGRERWRAATDERTRHEHRLLSGTLRPDELARLNGLLAALLVRFEGELGTAPTHGQVSRRRALAAPRTRW